MRLPARHAPAPTRLLVVLLVLLVVAATAQSDAAGNDTDRNLSDVGTNHTANAVSAAAAPSVRSETSVSTLTPAIPTSDVSSAVFRSSVATSPPSTGTCQSRTVNYITHRLPQKCLKTGWAESAARSDASTRQIEDARRDGAPAATETAHDVAKAIQSLMEKGRADLAAIGGSSDGRSATTENGTSTDSPSPTTPSASSSLSPPSAPSSSSLVPGSESDADALIDTAPFLSFEEWKEQNLAKAGQSAEHVGRDAGVAGDKKGRRRPDVNHALDSLGEDAELELDFEKFGHPGQGGWAGASATYSRDLQTPVPTAAADDGGSAVPPRSPGKDAGKTCKERFNYASFDCAATVLKTNAEARSASAVLVENKDSYMLNECGAASRFVIVELCDTILVDTIVLANFEFFSSIFRRFAVAVTDRWPVPRADRWRDLGTFEARNTRDIQAFWVREPLIWARYLKIEFLDHYGSEFYCPLSLVRVHGTTMMEEFRAQEEAARGEPEDEEPPVEVTDEPPPPSQTAETVAEPGAEKSAEQEVKSETNTTTPSDPSSSQVSIQTSASGETTVASDQPPVSNSTAPTQAAETEVVGPSSATNASTSVSRSDLVYASNQTESIEPSSSSTYSTASDTTNSTNAMIDASSGSNTASDGTVTTLDISRNATVYSGIGPSMKPSTKVSTKRSTQASSESVTTSIPSNTNSTAASTNSATNSTASSPSQNPPSVPSPSIATISTPKPASTPATQESFFKSLHKRLQSLESNTTLSLQYIESQSRQLRDALAAATHRQRNTTAAFLAALNASLFADQRALRADYARLWDGTVLELEALRDQHDAHLASLTDRLGLLAAELVWQRRAQAVQAALLAACLGLVLFSRVTGSVVPLGATAPTDRHAQRGALPRARSVPRVWASRSSWWDASPLSSPGAATPPPPHDAEPEPEPRRDSPQAPRRRTRAASSESLSPSPSPSIKSSPDAGRNSHRGNGPDVQDDGDEERLHPGRVPRTAQRLGKRRRRGRRRSGEGGVADKEPVSIENGLPSPADSRRGTPGALTEEESRRAGRVEGVRSGPATPRGWREMERERKRQRYGTDAVGEG